MKKLITLLLVLLFLPFVLAGPNDPTRFGNTTTNTVWIGGSEGIGNFTGWVKASTLNGTTIYQSGNKESRISTQRFEVQNMIYMPKNWEYKYPLFYGHIMNHRLSGQKKLDDAADTLTGIIENMTKKQGKILAFGMN